MLLDLVFIILNSADVALAFNVLYDSEAGCLTDNDHNNVRSGHFHGRNCRRTFIHGKFADCRKLCRACLSLHCVDL